MANWLTTQWRRLIRGDDPGGTLPIYGQAPSVILDVGGQKQTLFGGAGSHGSLSRIRLSRQQAWAVTAVWTATNFLADLIADLPIVVQRRRGGSWEAVANSNRTQRLLNGGWTEVHTSYAARQKIMTDCLLTGAGYARIERDERGQLRNLYPLQAEGMAIELDDDGRRWYRYSPLNEQGVPRVREVRDRDRLHPADIIDITFQTGPDGLRPVGPVAVCSDALVLNQLMVQHALRFFANGGLPPIIMKAMAMPKTEDGMTSMREDVRQAITISNQLNGIMITPPDFDPTALPVDLEKQQMIAQRRFQLEDIGRAFQLPKSFLHDLTDGKYATATQAAQYVAKYVLGAWQSRWESELTLKLAGRAPTTRIRFDLTELLRGDPQAQANTINTLTRAGVMTQNEARERVGLERYDDPAADMLLVQSQMTPIAMLESQGGTSLAPGGGTGDTDGGTDPDSDPDEDTEGDDGTG